MTSGVVMKMNITLVETNISGIFFQGTFESMIFLSPGPQGVLSSLEGIPKGQAFPR